MFPKRAKQRYAFLGWIKAKHTWYVYFTVRSEAIREYALLCLLLWSGGEIIWAGRRKWLPLHFLISFCFQAFDHERYYLLLHNKALFRVYLRKARANLSKHGQQRLCVFSNNVIKVTIRASLHFQFLLEGLQKLLRFPFIRLSGATSHLDKHFLQNTYFLYQLNVFNEAN